MSSAEVVVSLSPRLISSEKRGEDADASLRPQTYGQDLAAAGREFEELAEGEARKQRADQDRANRGRGEALARAAAAPEEKAADANGRFDLQQGVQSVAQAGDVGELFGDEDEAPPGES